MGLLTAAELRRIEDKFPAGLGSAQVIALFQEKGERFSEATLRKYVQIGLLPKSHRVGTRGRHRGSRGSYPVVIVRLINDIKRALDGGATLDERTEEFWRGLGYLLVQGYGMTETASLISYNDPLQTTPGSIGVIASVSEPFCDTCNRLRLTAEGQMRNCLFALEETDLRAPMRDGATDDELIALIRANVWAKWSGHRINHPDFVQPARSMSMIGG